jgi:hypothetical protein
VRVTGCVDAVGGQIGRTSPRWVAYPCRGTRSGLLGVDCRACGEAMGDDGDRDDSYKPMPIATEIP